MSRPENVRCETCVFWEPPSDVYRKPRVHEAPRDGRCYLEPSSPFKPKDSYCGKHRTTWPPTRDFVRVDLDDQQKTAPGAFVLVDMPSSDTPDDQPKTALGAMAPPGAVVVVLGDHGREWYRVVGGRLLECGRPTWATA